MSVSRLIPDGPEEVQVELAERWPRIWRKVRGPAWEITIRLAHWERWVRPRLNPAEQAAAYEEWADFYRWRLEQRTGELAGDDGLWNVVARDTDEIVYCFRRSAAYARGEDPGEWVPFWVRRPDLAEQRGAYATASQLVGDAA